MPGDGGKNFGLSSRSALNDRYFADNKSTTRSKSLDNLLPATGAGNTAEENFFGLSESRLNQRYLSQVPIAWIRIRILIIGPDLD